MATSSGTIQRVSSSAILTIIATGSDGKAEEIATWIKRRINVY